MRATSSGNWTIVSPLNVNIITIVKSSATSVSGEIRGRNVCSYQASPFARTRTTRLIAPAANGMPR